MSRLSGKTDRTLINLGMLDLSPSLFQKSKIGLRFELGDPFGNTNSMEYFNNCFDRAFAVYEKLSSDFNILRINLFYPITDSEEIIEEDKETDLGIICSATGLPLPIEERVTNFVIKDEDGNRTQLLQIECYWDLNNIIFDNRELIMQILLSDFPNFKGNYQFEGAVYFIDSRNDIILNIYDDRGMDIVANKEGSLYFIYEEFNHFLLQSDKWKMDRMFSGFKERILRSSIIDKIEINVEELGFPSELL